jgi:hypothetical protein
MAHLNLTGCQAFARFQILQTFSTFKTQKSCKLKPQKKHSKIQNLHSKIHYLCEKLSQ